ncbi:MAG: ATP phosphoribosyltransferase regulatory subunit [Parvibaculales bacterium]
MLTSPAEIIDALGGTKKVADMLGVGASAISNYRRDGFPAAKHYALAKACEASGLVVDDSIFGGTSRAVPRHFRYDNPVMAERDQLAGWLAAGYQQVETAILQPSAPFINRMGAEMQRRLYRFTDPGGEELCLRPDLTLPTVLDYVQTGRYDEARLCYQGTAFRYQPRGAGKPEEFTQMGLEIINGKTGDAALEDDIEVLTRLLTVIQSAGVIRFKVVVSAAAGNDGNTAVLTPQARLDTIIPPSPDAMIAGRSGQAIRRRLADKQKLNDLLARQEPKQASQAADEQTLAQADRFISRATSETGVPAEWFVTNPVNTSRMRYYTGLSFEIEVPELGPRKVIASGGRYDDLVQSLGAPHQIPAVGGAIAVERMQEAATRQAGQQVKQGDGS